MEKFEVGQKVETPIGTGIITHIDNFEQGDSEVYVSFNGMPEISFDLCYIKLYKTAHDKLIENGFIQKYGKYHYEKGDIQIDINHIYKTFKVYSMRHDEIAEEVGSDLGKILIQYLEELQ